MGKKNDSVKMARPGEPEAVRTKIVRGGRPQREVIPRRIPRGLEVLIKKAAVDPAFKKLLLEKRAGAAEAIGLKLTAAEETMLDAVPRAQLEAIVANTKVSPKLRPAFLGHAAVVMLAALGTVTVGCCTKGHAPDIPDERPSGPPNVLDHSEETTKEHEKGDEPVTRGIRPDKP